MKNTFQRLTPRDKMLALFSIWGISLLLLWFVGIAPAWTTLKTSAHEQNVLQNNLSKMKEQSNQAALWKKAPEPSYKETLIRLTQSLNTLLPNSTLSTQGEQSIIRVDTATGADLEKLLSNLRSNANLKPQEWHMSKNPQGLWTGTISFKLPASS